ncbi:AF4/FMR2 family member 1 isoform X2 [Electrophorus electricus]|uniref:AF4/FMR2 family member 1 isoform X2 n=1 Tax=Electrophorus electricus TaxID=8005 RepID=UPI0015D01344|nr:AF4/FMR2 family member 1 isoform X2 [Electrophorus electricus]
MAGQSSLREDLNILRRREWERRNQETQQSRDLSQESTPLFGEPYKTNKGDELSSLIQRMLGNYEDGNSCLYDGVVKDCPPAPTTTSSLSASYGRPGGPTHRDDPDPLFQNASSYAIPQSAQGEHSSGRTSEFAPAHGGDGPLDAQPDGQDYSVTPPVLPGLTPPADPLSPLLSSDSEHQGDDPLSPVPPEEPSRRPRARKEATQAGGEGLPPASQTLQLPLPSKGGLAHSRKPMALVRPMDGPEQVASESPDLKASPEDFHRQSYEGSPQLKTASKPSAPPLKMHMHSVELQALSSEVHCVEDILREMTHSWPPLLTAIHTPSAAELSKFSFPSKETHVHSGYQQPQKHHEPSSRVSLPPCVADPVACAVGGAAAPAPSSGPESGSDSESSSVSESDSESSEHSRSGVEESSHTVRSSTPPVKAEGTKDISWQLISWIKENQQNLNSQNHDDIAVRRDPKTTTDTKPQPHSHLAEDSKPRSKRHYNSHTAPAPQPGLSHVTTEMEPVVSSQLAAHKPPASRGDAEVGPRKTVGTKHPGKGRKAPPLPENPQGGLRVESVAVTARDKESAFTDRPKVKTKSGGKSDRHRQAKRAPSDRKEGEDMPLKATVTTEERKEVEPAPSPSPASQRPRSPPAKSRAGTGGVWTETLAPVKSSKKIRTRSPARDGKRDCSSRAAAGTSRALLVKIELSQLSRVPQPPKAAKPNRAAVPQKAGQEKEPHPTGRVGKKRPAENTQLPVCRKKVKPESASRQSSSSQHCSGKTQSLKTTTEERLKKGKSSKKAPAPAPHPPGSSQGRRRRPEEEEEGGQPGGKHRRKGRGKPEQHSKSHKKTMKRNAPAPEPTASWVTPAAQNDASAPGPTASGVAPATERPLLQFDDKQYSVDYHMKEAKKLKHKADATLDKMGKAFSYLDAAMSFVESGIAMETDPQTPKSAYTMFSETVDLIRFILKLKNYFEPSAPASERDFLVLCMRCQSLLQMAMFRCKRDSALKYMRMLTDHFKNSKTVHAPSPCISNMGTPSPMSPTPSPASSASSGAASNPGGSSTVAIPQVVQQMACSYVNITALFLSAHDTWEQADELARKGSGLLHELDRALGQLSLTSSMAALVRYTRQGLHWLRLDASV